jgi:hypothetical protein
VLAGVRREWDELNEAFAWLTSMLSAEVQARAFDHRGGPPAPRRPTVVTSLASAALGLYLLSFLPGPSGDPLAPFAAGLAVVLLVDSVRRFHATRRGRYAPSLLRFVLPSGSLRPERAAWRAHRDVERQILLDTGER